MLTIIYVDDEPDLLEMFSEIFSTPDITIRGFSDPDQAIAEIKKTPVDLVFLDYRLKKTTGDKVALQIDPKIPKALITGDLQVKCEAEFKAYFEKPMKIDEIRNFISSFVKH